MIKYTFEHESASAGYEARLHRFVNQLGDYFASDKTVVGSSPTGAPNQSSAQSCLFRFPFLYRKWYPCSPYSSLRSAFHDYSANKTKFLSTFQHFFIQVFHT